MKALWLHDFRGGSKLCCIFADEQLIASDLDFIKAEFGRLYAKYGAIRMEMHALGIGRWVRSGDFVVHESKLTRWLPPELTFELTEWPDFTVADVLVRGA